MWTPALVGTNALSSVLTGNRTLGWKGEKVIKSPEYSSIPFLLTELAMQSIVSFGTLALVLLDALASV